jgi:hypothetical protein
MKKLMLLLAVAGLIFVSCGTKTQPAEAPEVNPYEVMLDKWATLDELTPEDQIALVGEMKAFLDECKEKCKEKCTKEEATEEVKEECPVMAQLKADWANFENLEIERQIECINWIVDHYKNCCKDKKEGCCKKDKEETCANHE